jgi:hypothetical protein
MELVPVILLLLGLACFAYEVFQTRSLLALGAIFIVLALLAGQFT